MTAPVASGGERWVVLCCRDGGHGRHLAEELRGAGYSVRNVAELPETLATLRETPADLVIVELATADVATVAALRQLCPTVMVAIAALSMDSVSSLIAAGAYDVLPLPLRAKDLLWALTKAQAREAALGDRTASRFAPVAASVSGGAPSPSGLIAKSKVMQSLLAQVARVAVHPTPVLLLGESGTGKEVLARVIHQLSPRRSRPFVAVNCGALPEALLESLLFGHVQGAFTDAIRDQPGVFRQADGGTLFLDEIGELPLQLQVKLLRALQEHKILPLGARDEIAVDVRVIAATLRNLSREAEAARFRADLYYRLSVVELQIPPLRERRDDILPLDEHFLHRAAQRLGRPVVGMTEGVRHALLRFNFPGNVRELENLIERAVVLCEKTQLDEGDFPYSVAQSVAQSVATDASHAVSAAVGALAADSEGRTCDLSVKAATARLERSLITRALHQTRGNRTAAARLLELSHRALLYKLREYGMAGAPSSAPISRRPSPKPGDPTDRND